MSRVGGAAQTKGMKKVSGRVRLDLASYRELEGFAAFASDLDDASKRQLARGSRLVEVLKQGEHHPWSVEDQIVTIYLASNGYYDEVPVEEVRRFEEQLMSELHRNSSDIFDAIDGGAPLTDEVISTLVNATEAFKKIFRLSDGSPLRVEAMEEDAVAQETLQVKRTASRKG